MVSARISARAAAALGVGRAICAARAVVVGAFVLALSGCAGGGAQGSDGSLGSGRGEDTYDCRGFAVPASVLADPVPATELGPDGRAALDGMEVPPPSELGDLAAWSVVTESADRLVLVRPLDEPQDLGGGDLRTHELLAVEVVDASNVPPPGWVLRAMTTCSFAVPGAGSATVTLDPDSPPDPTSAQVPLLVTETRCNGGEDAEGRVEVVELRETADTVEVVLAVRPRDVGDATCQSNPPTPFLLELEAPLGERTLLDASVVPPRPVLAPTTTEP